MIFVQTLVHSSFLTRSRRNTARHNCARKRVCSLSKMVAPLSTAGVSDEVAQELQMPMGPQMLEDVEEPMPARSANSQRSWHSRPNRDGTAQSDKLSESWSDTVQKWRFRSGRRFASCLRGGGRGQFSAARRFMGAGCRFTSQEATRHWYQAGKRRCSHTFPPPGGS